MLSSSHPQASQFIRLARPLIATAVLAITLPTQAQQVRSNPNTASPPSPESKPSTYIGVFTSPASPPLRAQFPKWLESDQGVVVQRVVRNSPAQAAGIEAFDVLVALNDAPLNSADQLQSKVNEFDAGTQITLTVIRQAELREIPVVVADRKRVRVPRSAAGIQQNSDQLLSQPGATNRSIQVQSLDGMRYRISISFLDTDESQQQTELEGTVDELRVQAGELPRLIGDDVRRILGSLAPSEHQARALKLNLKPMLRGNHQVLRVSITQPGQGGAIRIVDVQHDFGEVAQIDVGELVELPALQAQLQQLSPSVRTRIVSTLKRTKIPRVQINSLLAQ